MNLAVNIINAKYFKIFYYYIQSNKYKKIWKFGLFVIILQPI